VFPFSLPAAELSETNEISFETENYQQLRILSSILSCFEEDFAVD
jgi:hypothetical protein